MTRTQTTESLRRWKAMRVFGIGALAAGAVTVAIWLVLVALLVAPLVFWLAWNVLDFGPAIGLPELGLLATVLATLFLVIGWFGKVVLTGVVFLVDPSWLQREAVVRWATRATNSEEPDVVMDRRSDQQLRQSGGFDLGLGDDGNHLVSRETEKC
jgi:hypothetical protein